MACGASLAGMSELGEALPPAGQPALGQPALGQPPEPAPPVRPTRAGRLWVTIVLGMVVLALLLVFIFQNLHHTTVHFFTASGSIPVALALLFAALAGAAFVVLVGSVRIVQLRKGVRRSFSEGAGHSRRVSSAQASEAGPVVDTEQLTAGDDRHA